jgi:hypothetical protein
MVNPNLLKDAFGIYRYHRDANPFYRKVLDSTGGGLVDGEMTYEEWLRIPIMKNKDLQIDMAERAGCLNKRKLHFHSTSGSSGIPFHIHEGQVRPCDVLGPHRSTLQVHRQRLRNILLG